ncbi:MAG: fumarylacetoacetate hydrolase family protein [Myxococcota bacterium]
MKWLALILLLLVALVLTLGAYLYRPLAHEPVPADFTCLDLSDGSFVTLEPPTRAYGVGLSYAGHIHETASDFDPEADPPVFPKHPHGFVHDGAVVPAPTSDAMFSAADALEPGLGPEARQKLGEISPLLDYEVELGVVLLDDVDPKDLERDDYVPNLGFFIANDLSSRSLALLGEGKANRYEFWGASKSFPGFMPVGAQAFVPRVASANGLPCIEIQTRVNGEVRQQQNTRDMIYTPLEMLRFVHAKYPDRPLEAGDVILTGTPSGVAVRVPRPLVRLANLVGLDRFAKLEAALGKDQSRFLEPGDEVVVVGEGLGDVSITIGSADTPLDRGATADATAPERRQGE